MKKKIIKREKKLRWYCPDTSKELFGHNAFEFTKWKVPATGVFPVGFIQDFRCFVLPLNTVNFKDFYWEKPKTYWSVFFNAGDGTNENNS
jgi:hypothetical protein